MVLKRFIELAEQKVTEAQAKADQVQTSLESTTTSAAIDDLEASETPESILLSTVSGEQSRDRTDRAIVTPWLKFLWETYRTVLDILKNNARLEVMYQSTAHQAFQFCLKYTRKTEFRRLCELLRNHLQNAAKYSSQMNAINLSDPDTLQRHLDTRFQQLNVAVELELWQEAFRSIEDIHTLLNLSKRPAKNIMMANYFEKLTRIFLVSENFLFHAAAWSRYYNLLRQSAAVVATGQSPKKDNPSVTEQETTKVASYVLLSALAIPVISTTRSRGVLIDVDETRKSKNTRLTNLLGMNAAPTRASIFKDALSKGLLRKARPEIRELYNILEVEFHPLSICKRISPILSQIGADPEMEKYVLPLQQVILTRLFQQLSQVYESVELKFVLDLAQFPDPYQVSSSTVEKFIMNGCKKGDLAIRIDHATGVLTFDSDVFSSSKALHPGSGAGSAEDASAVQRLQSTPAEIVRSSLTRLAKTLFVTCQYVDPTFNEDRQKAKQAALLRAREGAEQEHLETLQRKEIITKRKETAASVTAAREKEEAHRKRLQAQQLQAAETERLEREQRKRDEDRLKAEKDRIRRAEIEKELQTLKEGIKGVDLNEFNIDDLDTGRIRAIKLAALEKEKNELGYKLRVTGRRIDHLERAFRQEEIKHLPADYEAQRQLDLEAYEKSKEETMKEAQLKHTEDVALKHRLSRLVSPYEKFRDQVRQQRHAEFEKRRKAAEKELQNKMDQRKREIRERKANERREREEAARKAREEEERLAKEAEETAAKEEKERQKKAEALARREEERKYVEFCLFRLKHSLTFFTTENAKNPLAKNSSASRKPKSTDASAKSKSVHQPPRRPAVSWSVPLLHPNVYRSAYRSVHHLLSLQWPVLRVSRLLATSPPGANARLPSALAATFLQRPSKPRLRHLPTTYLPLKRICPNARADMSYQGGAKAALSRLQHAMTDSKLLLRRIDGVREHSHVRRRLLLPVNYRVGGTARRGVVYSKEGIARLVGMGDVWPGVEVGWVGTAAMVTEMEISTDWAGRKALLLLLVPLPLGRASLGLTDLECSRGGEDRPRICDKRRRHHGHRR